MSGDWFSEQQAGSVVYAADILVGEAWDHLLTLVELGCLVSTSKSRDGGSLSVTVTYEGQWRREWFRDAEAAAVWLGHGAKAVAELRTSPPSSGTVQRLRGKQNGVRAR